MAGKTVAVKALFTAQDGISRALAKMGDRAESFGRRATKSMARLNAATAKTSGIMGGFVGGMVISRGLFAIESGVRGVIREFADLDQSLTEAAAKFPERIQRGTKAFDELDKAARRVGASTQFTAAEAAGGLNYLAMAGFNAEQAIASLPAVVDLATAGSMDLARATDIASDALGAFNLMSKDSAVLAQNLGRINDVFAKTVTSANVDLETLFETMKDGAPVMTTAGQSLETFAALAGVMGNAGIKGSKAGTTLKNMATQLAAPVGKGAAVLERLGVRTKDAGGNLRDMLDILDDFRKATQKLGSAERAAAIDAVFGKRAIAGVSVVLEGGVDVVRDFRKNLEGAGGAAAQMAEDIRGSLTNRLKTLKSGLIDLGFKFIEAFATRFPNALDTAIKAIQTFDFAPIVDGFGTLIDYAKTIKNLFVEYFPVIGAVASAYAALTIALKVAAAAQLALNIVTALNPWMLLIMAIGAAVFFLWYYWDEVQAFTEGVISGFFDMTDEINTAMVNLGIGIYNMFVDAWNSALKITISAANKIIDVVGGLLSKIGIEYDAGIHKAMNNAIMDSLAKNKKIEYSVDDLRGMRQRAMGLPVISRDEEVILRSQLRDMPTGDAERAGMWKPQINPANLKAAFEQTTDVNIDLDFKNLAAMFDQGVTVDATAASSNGAKTTVNKKRAGKN